MFSFNRLATVLIIIFPSFVASDLFDFFDRTEDPTSSPPTESYESFGSSPEPTLPTPIEVGTLSNLTSLEELNSTWIEIKEAATSLQVGREQISDFSRSFMGYERRIRSFIDNVRRGYLAMNTDTIEFLEELRGYMEQLPKNQSKIVTKRYRSKCYCRGRYWEPCPEYCMDSCFWIGYINSLYHYKHFDNCTYELEHGRLDRCRCYEDSGISCTEGIHQCYEEKIEQVPDEEKIEQVPDDEVKPCQEFILDQSLVEKSFSRFADLLLEPLKILVRDLDFQVSSLKQAVIATNLLSNITAQLCEGQKAECFPEATELLDQKMQLHKQRKRNITLEMIKTQEQAETASKNIHVLKEQTFAQISQSIKEYTCCLKSFNFTVTDNDCNPKPVETTTPLSIPPPPPLFQTRRRACTSPDFLCENKRCVGPTAVCDGYDDCGDMSDEKDC
ncbi:hypothetical protein GE061_002803 [Apolygus lucorum]|uniref:Uncharacterized protein n=1 Tax=Apolygus lucorum TaxID=248454 RepID=A0A6A4J7E6_APOLU|nr:hypothetical protein GE061_002803 [Apolygus lucorum]